MGKYNYTEAMHYDVMEYIKDNYTITERLEKLENRDEWETELHDSLWVEDSVTGNASGSYTFNRHLAKKYVIDNIEILADALHEFCTESKEIGERFLNEDWEYFDVTIRCFLLSGAIVHALDELEEFYNRIFPKVED